MTPYIYYAAAAAALIALIFAADILFSYKKRKIKSAVEQAGKFYASKNYDVLFEDSPDGGGALSMWLSEDTMLYGRPDLVVKDRDTGEVRVVDYKSGFRKSSMPFRHRVQLAAYFILVEHEFNVKPSKGVIKYLEDESEDSIDNDPVFKDKVAKEAMALAETKRALIKNEDLDIRRSHNDAVKCNACEYKAICPEKI